MIYVTTYYVTTRAIRVGNLRIHMRISKQRKKGQIQLTIAKPGSWSTREGPEGGSASSRALPFLPDSSPLTFEEIFLSRDSSALTKNGALCSADLRVMRWPGNGESEMLTNRKAIIS